VNARNARNARNTRNTRRAFSVAVFARHAGRCLLIKHARLQTWLPVGGELEPGETPLDAARRELFEETRLEGEFAPIADIDGVPPGLIGYEEHAAGSKGLHMNFVFAADVATDRVVPNEEYGAFEWVRDSGHLDAPANVHQLLRVALHGGGSGLVGLARAWLDAFNARDLERLLALYDDAAVHTSPKLRARSPETLGRVAGKDALRAWWQDAMQRLPTLRYEEKHLTAMGDRVVMEYVRTVSGEEPLLVAEVLVARSARIVESHVFHG
jgi:8-oxo-dGTP diphosphatase